MEIKKTQEITASKINCLIYAQSGNGKTTLARTLKGKTLIISLESGLLSLRGSSIDYVEVDGKNGIEKIKNLKTILSEVEKTDYENIFIDSLTEISQCFAEYAKKEYPDDKQTMKMYGYVLDLMTRFIKYVRDMDKNCFFTALEKVDKDELNRRYVLPDLVGSISSKCPQYFDFVFYLKVFEKDNIKTRALTTNAQDGYVCKDRSGALEEYEPADLQAIIDKVFK